MDVTLTPSWWLSIVALILFRHFVRGKNVFLQVLICDLHTCDDGRHLESSNRFRLCPESNWVPITRLGSKGTHFLALAAAHHPHLIAIDDQTDFTKQMMIIHLLMCFSVFIVHKASAGQSTFCLFSLLIDNVFHFGTGGQLPPKCPFCLVSFAPSHEWQQLYFAWLVTFVDFKFFCHFVNNSVSNNARAFDLWSFDWTQLVTLLESSGINLWLISNLYHLSPTPTSLFPRTRLIFFFFDGLLIALLFFSFTLNLWKPFWSMWHAVCSFSLSLLISNTFYAAFQACWQPLKLFFWSRMFS